MSSLPALKPYRILRILKKAGFYVHHQTGSHIVLRHKADKTKRVTLPIHKKELKIRTLKSILSQAGISAEKIKK